MAHAEIFQGRIRPRWQKFRNQILDFRPFATSLAPWPGGKAVAVSHPPKRLIPGDPDFGQSIYARRLTANELGQFNQLTWLRHLTVSGKSLHAIYAAGLLVAWCYEQQPKSFGAEAAKALISLSTDAPYIVARMPGFEVDLMRIVTTQTKRVFAWSPRGACDKILRALALNHAIIAFDGFVALRETATAALNDALPHGVLADGGHISRNGDELLKLLMLLVPLRHALIAAHQPVPDELHKAIERMFPMLRMLCHGDGGLAHFGGTRSHIEVIEVLLATDQNRGDHLCLAPQSGIARLQQGELMVLADCGDPCLPIEISNAAARLFSSQFEPSPEFAVFPASLDEGDAGSLLHMHAGETCSRDIYLAGSGDDLRGEDIIPPESFVRVQFAEDVSVLEVGAREIKFMAADTSLWSLAQRGGVFEQGTEYQRVVRLDPDEPSRVSKISWGLRPLASD
jgi:uncharacterized heparinase superfamily protein